jgi:biopolymer transport protein ExbD
MDIFLAVVVFLLTSAMAFLGVYVSLHPPQTAEAKSSYKTLFVMLSLLAAGVIAFQAYVARRAQADLENKLAIIKKNTEQPPKVVVENAIDPKMLVALKNQFTRSQLERINQETPLQHEQSVKIAAFSFSTDVQTFIAEREKGRPPMTTSWRPGEPTEQLLARAEKDRSDYQEYEKQTTQIFQDRYWNKALQVLLLLRTAGFNTESVWYQPTSDEQIKAFVLGMANVAEKSPPR